MRALSAARRLIPQVLPQPGGRGLAGSLPSLPRGLRGVAQPPGQPYWVRGGQPEGVSPGPPLHVGNCRLQPAAGHQREVQELQVSSISAETEC